MVDGGDIDVLTGDWLAELTMLILARQRLAHGPGSGYARTFLTQLWKTSFANVVASVKRLNAWRSFDANGVTSSTAAISAPALAY